MAHSILLKNARVIDGIANQPQTGASILVTGDRISKVERGEIPVPPDAQVIDLGGKTVLSGLIDTHIHSTFMDRECMPLFLAAGVTTARDVGGKLEKVKQLKADLNSGAQLGPRLFICGPLLDGAESSFDPRGLYAELLDSIPTPEAVPQKIGVCSQLESMVLSSISRFLPRLRKLSFALWKNAFRSPAILATRIHSR